MHCRRVASAGVARSTPCAYLGPHPRRGSCKRARPFCAGVAFFIRRRLARARQLARPRFGALAVWLSGCAGGCCPNNEPAQAAMVTKEVVAPSVHSRRNLQSSHWSGFASSRRGSPRVFS
ncbi:unnamed protein product [Amoebophrya sp. A120]|nr:unnamed protein product [Amoebophrya sp. A120]|eukprot:GSA120T00025058001.1